MDESSKNLTIRCRQLGHDVPLSYCLKMNIKLPCSEIIRCWEKKVKISEYIIKKYTEDEIAEVFSIDNNSKIEKLVGIINKYNKEAGEQE